MDGRTDGWTDGQMDGQTDRRTDGWMDGRTKPLIELLFATKNHNVFHIHYGQVKSQLAYFLVDLDQIFSKKKSIFGHPLHSPHASLNCEKLNITIPFINICI